MSDTLQFVDADRTSLFARTPLLAKDHDKLKCVGHQIRNPKFLSRLPQLHCLRVSKMAVHYARHPTGRVRKAVLAQPHRVPENAA